MTVIKMSDLTPAQRRLVLALIDADRSAKIARGELTEPAPSTPETDIVMSRLKRRMGARSG